MTTPLNSDQSVREAARAVVDAHRAVIEGVTPKHPNWCATDRDEYDARFSRWHSTTRALRAALDEDHRGT